TRKKIEGLKDKADLAVADRGQLVVIHRGNILAVKLVAPGARRIEAAEHIHERRFPTPARAHDGEILVAMNLESHTAQGMDGFLAHDVMLGDIFDVDDDRTAWAHRL